MEYFEQIIASVGFLLIGLPAGFFAFLIFRISIHQQKFQWAGALAVVTTLCGGGFLTYQSRPLHFGLYAIGFVVGFFMYLSYLRNYSANNSTSRRRSFSKPGSLEREWIGDEVEDEESK